MTDSQFSLEGKEAFNTLAQGQVLLIQKLLLPHRELFLNQPVIFYFNEFQLDSVALSVVFERPAGGVINCDLHDEGIRWLKLSPLATQANVEDEELDFFYSEAFDIYRDEDDEEKNEDLLCQLAEIFSYALTAALEVTFKCEAYAITHDDESYFNEPLQRLARDCVAVNFSSFAEKAMLLKLR